MTQVFIIGLPVSLLRRVEATLEEKGFVPTIIAADKDRSGKLKLLPDPSVAAHKLTAYCDGVEGGYNFAEIYVLPYTPIPEDVTATLTALEGMGAQVDYFQMEVDGWPYLHKAKPRLDEPFLNAVFSTLLLEILLEDDNAEEELLPSQYIRAATERTGQLIVVANAIELCDNVAPGRYDFIRLAIDAFEELIELKGEVGTGGLEEFFRERGLLHAKSGGITIELEIKRQGKKLQSECSNAHLKKGDKTTPQSAARIYYQYLRLDDVFYLFLLYAGPHPDTDFFQSHNLD
ncbi:MULTISPECIES: hypothetical protein [unclassified Pseudomonas]|uniref:hypothetical protein n=1 Tax=unclassified Pseudomonas TaxID=196821 RepID=UPI001B334849|nr:MULTISPECIES: hypothetical protein [unclassified Pseudomonas]